ncbi:MAG: hypothetical protein IT573_02430 [Deltaproteobacteria bacterium]|nr:hypothetical protein [Deltaproteobacteria bacterium]
MKRYLIFGAIVLAGLGGVNRTNFVLSKFFLRTLNQMGSGGGYGFSHK